MTHADSASRAAFLYLIEEGELPTADEAGFDIETDKDVFVENFHECTDQLPAAYRELVADEYDQEVSTFGEAALVMTGCWPRVEV